MEVFQHLECLTNHHEFSFTLKLFKGLHSVDGTRSVCILLEDQLEDLEMFLDKEANRILVSLFFHP